MEILFVTQHDSPQMMREALEAGARGYVVKSNAARDLLEAVEAVSQHRVFTALNRRETVARAEQVSAPSDL
jgi:DNA-binding NarL/FixJ family response regulator